MGQPTYLPRAWPGAPSSSSGLHPQGHSCVAEAPCKSKEGQRWHLHRLLKYSLKEEGT